jgi:cephalosporin hydroxylase
LYVLLRLQVDDDWIARRLERWGQRDGMPFLGPRKAAILQQLVQQQQPQLAVEVGTMAGYSAIKIAQVRACCSASTASGACQQAQQVVLVRKHTKHCLSASTASVACQQAHQALLLSKHSKHFLSASTASVATRLAVLAECCLG